MKTWIKISCLILALALAGCAAGQPYRETPGTAGQEGWNPLWPTEPSAESTNWGLWLDTQGGG